MICGCQNRISLNKQLLDMGYSKDDIVLINNLNSEDSSIFYESYNSKLLDLLKDDRFDKDKCSTYFMYYREFEKDLLFFLVNNNYLNEKNHKIIRRLSNCSYFIETNLSAYMQHADEFDNTDDLIAHVNVGAYKDPYIDYVESDTSNPLLIIANKWHYLGEYEPEDLVTIDRKHGVSNAQQQLRKPCYDAFIKMFDAAYKDGISIYITSAYRSHDTQINIYNNYLSKDRQENVDSYSSRPGFSDHQTGLACDILSSGFNFESFVSSRACGWLEENAYKYGFILRFPKDKTDLTGYVYESWHYRYVGEAAAKYIHDHNICYEEYYAYFVEYDSPNLNA